MLTRVLVPKFHSRVTRGIVQHRQASSGSHDHDDPHSSHGTGWPKPSGRGQFKPVSQEEVNTALAKAQKGSQGQEAPPSIREEVLALEGWLFGKKVIYLNTKEPWYNQIPNEQQYLFGIKRKMSDWEILTYASWLAVLVMLTITWWAKPETDLYIWAQEELREREILAQREKKNLQL